MNLVILTGRLGKDPEIRHLQGGKSVANFSLATSAGKDQTDWHNIVCWEKVADNVSKYCSKGDQITVQGELKTRTWEKDGVTKYATEVVAYKIEFLGKANPETKKPDPSDYEPTDATVVDEKDDLPF